MSQRSPRRQSKPCPGCGATGEYRLVDQVCDDCKRVLKAARTHEQYAADLLKAGKELIALPASDSKHWWPSFYQGKASASNENHAARKSLAYALAELSTLSGEFTHACKSEEKNAGKLTHEEYSIYGAGCSTRECWQGRNTWSGGRLYLFNPRVAELFRIIYDAIGLSLELTDADGRRAGNNLLMELATGQLSIDEFNAAYVPPAPAPATKKKKK